MDVVGGEWVECECLYLIVCCCIYSAVGIVGCCGCWGCICDGCFLIKVNA